MKIRARISLAPAGMRMRLRLRGQGSCIRHVMHRRLRQCADMANILALRTEEIMRRTQLDTVIPKTTPWPY